MFKSLFCKSVKTDDKEQEAKLKARKDYAKLLKHSFKCEYYPAVIVAILIGVLGTAAAVTLSFLIGRWYSASLLVSMATLMYLGLHKARKQEELIDRCENKEERNAKKLKLFKLVYITSFSVIALCVVSMVPAFFYYKYLLYWVKTIISLMISLLLLLDIMLAEYLYRNIIAKKVLFNGMAISKNDIQLIRKKKCKCKHCKAKENNIDIDLYTSMVNFVANRRSGYTCFSILEKLKEGELLYLAVCLNPKAKDKVYVMHTLYVRNHWCYDPYAKNQIKLKRLLKVTKAQIYKSYTYYDIKKYLSTDLEIGYDNFKAAEYADISKWCAQNGYHQNWL